MHDVAMVELDLEYDAWFGFGWDDSTATINLNTAGYPGMSFSFMHLTCLLLHFCQVL